MQAHWIVMKFGGTSVAGRPQWDTVAALARERRAAGYRVLLVCSAVAGVTNRLEALADTPGEDEPLRELIELHRDLGRQLGVDERSWLAPAVTLLNQCLEDLAGSDSPERRAALLGAGEWISTRLGARFLQLQGIEAEWVDAREALEVRTESELSPARQWLSADCAAGPDPALEALWSGLAPVLVTQGFVARGPGGRTALLGRGGSDTSAALLAGRLQAADLEIWTDVPGLFSADPRRVPGARLLAEVDYAEALEMAASGARVVHPRCIRAAAATATPVQIRDLSRPQNTGTRIRTTVDGSTGVKTVTCREDMAVMLLQNLDARRQVGFLAGVFDVFRAQGVSIDLVATSETTTTVALSKVDNHLGAAGLTALADSLAAHCTVERFDDCACVNLVGRGVRTALARLSGPMQHFDRRPLLMASQSANDLCLSLLVPAGEHGALLQAAHDALVPAVPRGVFGPTLGELAAQQSSGTAAEGRP